MFAMLFLFFGCVVAFGILGAFFLFFLLLLPRRRRMGPGYYGRPFFAPFFSPFFFGRPFRRRGFYEPGPFHEHHHHHGGFGGGHGGHGGHGGFGGGHGGGHH